MGKSQTAVREAKAYAADQLRRAPATGGRAAVIARALTDNPIIKRFFRDWLYRFRCQCGKRHSLRGVSQKVAYQCSCGRVMRFERHETKEPLELSWRFVGVMVEIAGVPQADPLLVEEAAVTVKDLV